MTSVRETGRAAHGKGEATVGISKVPDARLDRLTAMYNPKKRVPATVEFTDLALPAGTGGAQALVDVAAYKNADALVHVLRAFQDPVGPASVRIGRPRARRAGDGRRADPRGPRRRRAAPRAAREGPEEEPDRRARTRARRARCCARPRSKTGGRSARWISRATISSGCAATSSSPPSRCSSSSTWTNRSSRDGGIERAAATTGLTPFLSRGSTAAVAVCAKIELEIGQLDARRRRGVSRRPRPGRIGAQPRDSRQLRPARLHVVLHRRRGRVPRLVDPAPHARRSSPPARSTATSRAASSAPRSSATII